MKSYQKTMILAAAAVLSAMSLTACNGTASSAAVSSAPTSTTSHAKFEFDVTAVAFSTTDWVEFTSLGEAKSLTADLITPGTWYNVGANILTNYTATENGKEVQKEKLVAYVGGLVLLSDGQTLPETIDNSKTKYDVVSEENVTIGSNTAKLRIIQMENQETGTEYRYEYYLKLDGKVFMMSFYDNELKNAEDLATFEKVLSSMTLRQSTAQQQAAASEAASKNT